MHRTSLAPVLSATRHRVSCWITALLLLGLFEDLDDPPPFGLGDGTCLDDPDQVADMGTARLVVRLQPGRAADDLPVHRVSDLSRDPHHHRPLHGFGDDQAGADLPPPPLLPVRAHLGVCHATQPPVLRARPRLRPPPRPRWPVPRPDRRATFPSARRWRWPGGAPPTIRGRLEPRPRRAGPRTVGSEARS